MTALSIKNNYLSLFSLLFFSAFKVVKPESASSASNKKNDIDNSVIRYYISLGGRTVATT
jgi:hypothetical protein